MGFNPHSCYENYPEVEIQTEGYSGGYLVRVCDYEADEYKTFFVGRHDIERHVQQIVAAALDGEPAHASYLPPKWRQ